MRQRETHLAKKMGQLKWRRTGHTSPNRWQFFLAVSQFGQQAEEISQLGRMEYGCIGLFKVGQRKSGLQRFSIPSNYEISAACYPD